MINLVIIIKCRLYANRKEVTSINRSKDYRNYIINILPRITLNRYVSSYTLSKVGSEKS